MGLSESEKKIFREAGERRKLAGIKSKLIRLFAEEGQVSAFYEIYETWVQRWDKGQAMDALIASIADFEARFQDLKRLVAERKKRRKK
jgi:hypothetical protein